jgi:hypothetical protein
MAQFIEGPLLGPDSLNAGAGVSMGTGKEILYDSTAARASYFDQQFNGGVSGAGVDALAPVEVVPAEEPLDPALMAAAAGGAAADGGAHRHVAGVAAFTLWSMYCLYESSLVARDSRRYRGSPSLRR